MLHLNVSSVRVTCFGLLVSVLAASALAGCDGSSATEADDHLLLAAAQPLPLPPATDFVSHVTNEFFPLTPGAVYTYRTETDEGIETTVVTVTHQTKTILGIQATVVRDQVFIGSALIEDTFDWFAQDESGNVWYLGEETCEFVNNQCASTEGSWEAGVDGALAGIIMWADPAAHKGQNYRQEFFEGEAEDMAKVLKVGVSVSVPVGQFSGCVETMDWTPLDPGAREHKFYCPGVGLVLETHQRDRNELVSVSRP